MTNTTTETLAVNGMVLNTYAYNIETNDGRMRSAGKRGSNLVIPGRNGQRRAYKRFDTLTLDLSMWVSAAGVSGGAETLAQWLANIDTLTRLFGSMDLLTLVQTRNSRTRTISGDVVDVIDPTTYSISYASKFVVAILCPYPFWADTSTTSQTFTGVGSFSLTGAAASTAPIDDAVIRFNGPCVNPSITFGGTTLTYTGTLASGQWVQFDCGAFVMTASGVAVNYALMTHTGDPRWLVIPPAGVAAPLTIAASSGASMTTTVTYTNKYLVG